MELPSIEAPGGAKASSAQSIKSCLDYLYRQAVAENFLMTAHLIGAAAESLSINVAEPTPTEASNGECERD
ncbi:MAG: hypothetical protein QF893_18365 [Alphaproteobacteria bacterium]|jgi:hypothetical protein|nr:hypothetical protein [Alphaproteobacteria bacterium]